MSPQTEVFELGQFSVTIALDAGPRILRFDRRGGPGLFAELTDAAIESAAGRLSLLGGHRLWRAPEVPAVTYRPDDDPITLDRLDNGFRLTGPPDGEGISKTIELRTRGDYAVVDHALSNQGEGAPTLAAWAITQLAPGGTAVIPQSDEPADRNGVLPNRSLILWPYTEPAAPEIELRAEDVRLHGSRSEHRAKVGTQNRRGWLAYALGEQVFVKWSPLHDDAEHYADLNASVECYRDHRFLELETIGPLTELPPGQTVRHREVWRLFDLQDQSLDELLASLPSHPTEVD